MKSHSRLAAACLLLAALGALCLPGCSAITGSAAHTSAADADTGTLSDDMNRLNSAVLGYGEQHGRFPPVSALTPSGELAPLIGIWPEDPFDDGPLRAASIYDVGRVDPDAIADPADRDDDIRLMLREGATSGDVQAVLTLARSDNRVLLARWSGDANQYPVIYPSPEAGKDFVGIVVQNPDEAHDIAAQFLGGLALDSLQSGGGIVYPREEAIMTRAASLDALSGKYFYSVSRDGLQFELTGYGNQGNVVFRAP